MNLRLNGISVFVKWDSMVQRQTLERKLKEGDVLTVKYQGENENKKLIFPYLVGIREDTTWENLKKDFLNKQKLIV